MLRNKKSYNFSEAFAKLSAYCAFQERSVQEVHEKSKKLGIEPSMMKKLIEKLQDEGFLDEQRFAAAYAGGKFRQNKWGKKKISWQLKGKGVKDEVIRAALAAEIDQDDYRAVAMYLAHAKWQSLLSEPQAVRWQKVLAYMLSKGYEQDVITDILKQL